MTCFAGIGGGSRKPRAINLASPRRPSTLSDPDAVIRSSRKEATPAHTAHGISVPGVPIFWSIRDPAKYAYTRFLKVEGSRAHLRKGCPCSHGWEGESSSFAGFPMRKNSPGGPIRISKTMAAARSAKQAVKAMVIARISPAPIEYSAA